jgi:hypothetical protein
MAKSVSCGPNFTMCIAHSKKDNSIGVLDEEETAIQQILSDYL